MVPLARSPVNRGLRKAIDLLFVVEPAWVIAALAAICLLVSLGVEGPWIWVALAVILLPFLLRLWRYHRLSFGTPFDIPIAIFLLGIFVGLWVSGDIALSLRAFATFIACASFYYTMVNYSEAGRLLKWGLPIYALIVAVVAIFAFGQGPSAGSGTGFLNSWAYSLAQSLPDLPITLGISGLALNLVVVAAICLGLVIFTKRRSLRAVTIPAFLFFLCTLTLENQASLARFFTGESIQGRIPLWTATFEMMNGYHIFTGIGLGYWAVVYNPEMTPLCITHPHNAYLQLYADVGILGLVALILAIIVVVRLSWRILRSPRDNPWYGFGIGVVMAIAATAVASIVISASFGIPVAGECDYRYLASPILWVLGALLVIAYRSLSSPNLSPKLEGR